MFAIRPFYRLIGAEALSQNHSQAVPAESQSMLFILQHRYLLLKERSWFTHGKGMYGFPFCAEHQEMLFFKQVGVLIFQRLYHPMRGGEVWRPDWKTALPTLISWASVTLLNAISPLLLLLSFFVGPRFSFPVFILHGSFQLTHFVSVFRQMRRSKITVSVVSHSFRSTGLHSKIALLDCSASGIIDQY